MIRRRVLVVGLGSIGERHVRCFQQTGRVSLSIAELNHELRNRIANQYGIQQSFGSLDAALAAEHDAVVICTPAHWHVSQAIQCAKRGLHVLIEKPLGIHLAGVEQLASIATDRRLVVGVAYVQRCQPALVAMREALQSGRFGSPLQVVGMTGQHFPTYRPAYREIYYADRAAGGGAIQDSLTHVINAAEWLVGPVSRVAADAAHQALQGVTVEDTVHVLARHQEVLACYSLNQYQAPNELTLTVVCPRGTLRFEAHAQQFRWMSEPAGPWQQEEIATIDRDQLFSIQANRFLDSLEGAPLPCSLAEGAQTLRVNLAVLHAAESQQWVKIDSI